jgi:hypothetical protein
MNEPALYHGGIKLVAGETGIFWEKMRAVQFNSQYTMFRWIENMDNVLVLNFIDMILVSNITSGLQQSCAVRISIIFNRKITFILSSYLALPNVTKSSSKRTSPEMNMLRFKGHIHVDTD